MTKEHIFADEYPDTPDEASLRWIVPDRFIDGCKHIRLKKETVDRDYENNWAVEDPPEGLMDPIVADAIERFKIPAGLIFDVTEHEYPEGPKTKKTFDVVADTIRRFGTPEHHINPYTIKTSEYRQLDPIAQTSLTFMKDAEEGVVF